MQELQREWLFQIWQLVDAVSQQDKEHRCWLHDRNNVFRLGQRGGNSLMKTSRRQVKTALKMRAGRDCIGDSLKLQNG